ncbi:uracil-DNA glycosylase, partial [Aureobasidium melanogenum]
MEDEVSPTFATAFVLTLDLDTACFLGVGSRSLLSDSDDDESDDDESEESETEFLALRFLNLLGLSACACLFTAGILLFCDWYARNVQQEKWSSLPRRNCFGVGGQGRYRNTLLTGVSESWDLLYLILNRSNIEVPVDHTIITISLLEPFICLGKVATVKLEVWSDYSCSVPRSPSQEDNAVGTLLTDNINDFLCEFLPALAGIPRCEQASFVGRRLERRVFLFQCFVDVLERWRSGGRRSDGEAEAMSLIEVMVRILTEDDCLDGTKRRVSRPEGLTSSDGGKIFLPDSASLLRNFFKSRNDFVVISSLSTASQLSCNVSISSLRRVFCSSVRPAIHFSLSKLTAGAGSVGPLDGLVDDVDGLGLGGPKKLVMELLAFGFFASAAAMSAALRLRDMVAIE